MFQYAALVLIIMLAEFIAAILALVFRGKVGKYPLKVLKYILQKGWSRHS